MFHCEMALHWHWKFKTKNVTRSLSYIFYYIACTVMKAAVKELIVLKSYFLQQIMVAMAKLSGSSG